MSPSTGQQQRGKQQKDTVTAKVYSYNPDIGFGFLFKPGVGNIFLHKDVANGLGQTNLASGTELKVAITQTPKGWAVERILNAPGLEGGSHPESEAEIDDSGDHEDLTAAGQEDPASHDEEPVNESAPGFDPFFTGEECVGTVANYDTTKNYGFVRIDDGRSLFLHIKALETSGINTPPNNGDRVSCTVRFDRRGRPSADSVRILEQAAA